MNNAIRAYQTFQKNERLQVNTSQRQLFLMSAIGLKKCFLSSTYQKMFGFLHKPFIMLDVKQKIKMAILSIA